MKSAIGETLQKYPIADHRRCILEEGKAQDIEKRIRWDYCFGAGLSPWICDNLYIYLNDTHIDTALKSIMRELA
jgi:hypothetical protein